VQLAAKALTECATYTLAALHEGQEEMKVSTVLFQYHLLCIYFVAGADGFARSYSCA
jgi:hypothetical protein